MISDFIAHGPMNFLADWMKANDQLKKENKLFTKA